MLLYYSIITDKTVKKNSTVYQIELENSPKNPGFVKTLNNPGRNGYDGGGWVWRELA